MKRISFFIAVATFFLTSCAKAPEVDNIGGDVMSFGTNIVETKTEKTSFVTNDKIGIIAHKKTATSTTFIADHIPATQKLTYGGANWTLDGSPTYLWPIEESTTSISFVAYSPDDVTLRVASGEVEIDWTVDATPTNQKDLLLDVVLGATATKRGGSSTNITSGATPFNMQHLLSKIQFKVEKLPLTGGGTSSVILIKKIEIESYKSATYSINGNFDGDNHWKSHGQTIAVTLYENSTGHTVIESSPQFIGEHALMIPSPTGGFAVRSKLKLSFSVAGTDTNIEQNITNIWDANKEYTYTIQINPNGDIIALEPTINAWGCAKDVSYE